MEEQAAAVQSRMLEADRFVSWLRPLSGVVKLTMNGCFRGNRGLSAPGGILHDHRGAFGSFLGHQLIFYAELMAILRGL